MPLLHVALQEGFEDEAVVVRVNSDEALNREGVRTRPQLGVAASVEVTVPEGPADVEVLLPERRLSETTRVQVSHPVYLAVSVRQDTIIFRTSSEPFRYA